MDNKINTSTSFSGKLILDKLLFPHHQLNELEWGCNKELLKNIVDTFEKETSGKSGTLVVKRGLYLEDYPMPVQTYFKNCGYIDSCSFDDNDVLKELTHFNSKANPDEIVKKLSKLFSVFKLREDHVTKEIAPRQKQIKKLQTEVDDALRTVRYECSKLLGDEKINRFGNFNIDGTANIPFSFKNFETIDIKDMEKAQNECLK